jgi:hypothetical protein
VRDPGAADMREWTIEGSGGRVTIRLPPPAHTHGAAPGASDRMIVEFSAELSGPGYFRGSSTARLAALDLVRFHRELGGVVAGSRRHATLGSLGDEAGLTLERAAGAAASAGGARLSGFIGAGLSCAVSFNDVSVDRSSLVRSYAALHALADEIARHAVLTTPPEPEADPPPLPPAAKRAAARRPDRWRRRSAH